MQWLFIFKLFRSSIKYISFNKMSNSTCKSEHLEMPATCQTVLCKSNHSKQMLFAMLFNIMPDKVVMKM